MMAQKTVLVTGASRGIGKATAIKFAKKNYNVVISCLQNEERLMQTKREIESYQTPCLAFMGDMGDMEQCRLLFKKIKKQFGSLDVLVNNAGISYIGLLQDMTTEDWNRVMNTNLTSVFNCCKLAIPDMVAKQAGKIINISSVWGVAGASCEVAYSATKGAVNAFTKALAKELAPSNIQVNAIACGAIDTEMNQWLEEDDLISLIDEIPSGRLGKAEEVADLVYHLGYKNAYLTGQVIGLDGGWIDPLIFPRSPAVLTVIRIFYFRKEPDYMPTTYTHHRFGNDVFSRLPAPLQEKISAIPGLFDIGLHGPDFLFYYKPLSKNPVNQRGHPDARAAWQNLFYSRPFLALSHMAEPDAGFAYICGFLCHFALDSTCHPYIEQQVVPQASRTAKLNRNWIVCT